MDVHADLEALKAWVRELFNHAGAHHSMPAPPVALEPTPKPAEEPAP